MIVSGLYIPRYIREGIKPNDRGGHLGRIIYGGDTETVAGKPNTLQFYSEDVACSDFYIVNEHNSLKKFLAWCAKRKQDHEHVVYVHNLRFDLVEFLYGVHAKLVAQGDEFSFRVGEWFISGVYGTPTFARIRNKTCRRTILLIDSYSFFKGSLKEASKLYCPDLPKLATPKDLGKVRIRVRDTSKVEYAMRDAEVSYHIGKAIDALHTEFDLKQCVSIADLAARVFRHRFLTYTIPQPSDDIVLASLDAYHGGKNNITVAPGWYIKTAGLDISSAYPDAMRALPCFSNARAYKRFRASNTRKLLRVPSYGVYTVSGTAKACRWPSLFAHDFTALSGRFEDVSVQGFELNEALRSGEVKLSSVQGWSYDEDKDIGVPALRAFVDDFYKRKETEKNKVKRKGYKDILNSLYGKFIQTRKRGFRTYVNIESGKVSESQELVAGGMFHPFIAATITAHTRAKMHGLEHEYQALHTATDGIFSQDSRAYCMKKADGLGSVGQDSRGTLLLIRTKLYIVYVDEPTKDTMPSRAFQGKHILKWALHGFQGKVFDLERLIASNRRKYKANHVNQLKESLKRGLQVNEFVQRDYTLKVGPLQVKEAA
jgi:hypothetical protein